MATIPTHPIVSAVDLFCGIGGLTYGLQKACSKASQADDIKINVQAGFDIDESCKFAYEKNNHAEFIHKDVQNITKCDIAKHYKDADVSILVGCAPCQPFSSLTHNRRGNKPAYDQKWGVLTYFSNLIKDICPDIVSMENVPGLRHHPAYDKFKQTLKSRKYKIWEGVVQCSDYGVPQSRKRLVLLASRYGEIQLIPPLNTAVNTVRNALSALSANASNDPAHISYNLSPRNLERIKASRPGASWKCWDKSMIVPCHRKSDFPQPYGRMSWDKPAPTITSQFCFYSCGRFGHPKKNRAVTIREGAVLQSFPKNYRFFGKNEGKKDVRTLARQVGNAVPPVLGRIIGRSIISHLASHRRAK